MRTKRRTCLIAPKHSRSLHFRRPRLRNPANLGQWYAPRSLRRGAKRRHESWRVSIHVIWHDWGHIRRCGTGDSRHRPSRYCPSISCRDTDSGQAFSGGNLYGQRSYLQINQTTNTSYPDPAIIYANLSTSLVNQLAKNTKPGSPLLPLAYGINVNYPSITSLTNTSCVAPKFYQTRLTGGAFTDQAVYSASSGLFTYANALGSGINTCINGDCSLPGETSIVNAGCQSSVSVFTVDYDAPKTRNTTEVFKALEPLVITNKTTSTSTSSKRSLCKFAQ